MEPETDDATGLSPLDWVVIVAATVAFTLGAIYLYQAQNKPQPDPPAE